TDDSSGPILVVSPDLDLRSCYCDLFVKNVPLDEAYPGSRLLPSGVRERLTQRSESGALDGVCFFMPNLSLPSNVGFRPKLVILVLRFTKWSRRLPDLIPWPSRFGSGVLPLYTLGDADSEQAAAANGFLRFPLDHAALSPFDTASSSAPLT